MSNILFQMNSLTRPSSREVPLSRQIHNYFGLLKNMSRLGLALAWEKKYGVKQFVGILDNPAAAAVYDDIVACVMHPETTDSVYFMPSEIDAMAATLSNTKLSLPRTLEFLRSMIISRLERAGLEQEADGDTHSLGHGLLAALAEQHIAPDQMAE